MAELFGVSPAGLRATSRRLGGVSSSMKDVLVSLREGLAGEGAAWGDDEVGDMFADGDAGYLAQLDWVGGSVDAKTGLVDFYSVVLKGAADSSVRYDGS